MTGGIVALVYRCRPVAGMAHPTLESVAVDRLMPEQVAENMIPAYAIRVMDA